MSQTQAQPKVGVLIDHLHVGGVQKVAIEQVKALTRAGYQAELVVMKSTPESDAFADLLQDIAVTYLDLRMPPLLRWSFPIPPFSFLSWYHFSYPLLLPWVVKKKEWQLLLAHNTTTSFTAVTLKWFKKIPYLWNVHDPLYHVLQNVYQHRFHGLLTKALSPAARWLDKLLLKNSGGVVVFGFSYLSYLRSLAGKKISQEIKLVPQGTSLQLDFIKEKQDYFVTASSWKPVKKLERLIRYFAELGKYRLKIIGSWVDQEYRSEIEQLIIALNMEDKIEIQDRFLPESEMMAHFQQARGLVLAKPEPGFGCTPWEAAACGCPAIIGSSTGIAHWLESDKEVFIYNPDCPEQIKQYVKRLGSDLDLAVTVGSAARQAVQKFTWDYHINLLRDLMQTYVRPQSASN